MLLNLLDELATVKAFFSHGMDLVDRIAEIESIELSGQHDNEFTEHTLTRPDGSIALEQMIYRSVVGELNSLYEFALQLVWIKASGDNLLFRKNENDAGEMVFVANRTNVETALLSMGQSSLDVGNWPRRAEVLAVKEMAEGFKHRHRLQPLPKYCYRGSLRHRAERHVIPGNDLEVADYEPVLTQDRIAGYISAFDELFQWLSSQELIQYHFGK